MNREILFRGKRLDTGTWIESDIAFKVDDGEDKRGFVVVGFDYNGINQPYNFYTLEVDPATVSQFTGLIDKNGKQIFEGDVIHHGDASELCLVTYIESGFYSVPTSKEKHTLSLEMWLSACVVIGNIFDNPELVAK